MPSIAESQACLTNLQILRKGFGSCYNYMQGFPLCDEKSGQHEETCMLLPTN
jgi:hypothetical protein